MNSTVAMSAMPIGMPGWPDFACSTASIASARSAFAMRRNLGSAGGGSGGAAVVMAANVRGHRVVRKRRDRSAVAAAKMLIEAPALEPACRDGRRAGTLFAGELAP